MNRQLKRIEFIGLDGPELPALYSHMTKTINDIITNNKGNIDVGDYNIVVGAKQTAPSIASPNVTASPWFFLVCQVKHFETALMPV